MQSEKYNQGMILYARLSLAEIAGHDWCVFIECDCSVF